MFGFALWDSDRGRLVIARDYIGIKPVYLYRDSTRLIFASEAKSILALPDIDADIDPVGLEEYLSLGYTPTNGSIFRGIEKLPPASLLICEDGSIKIRKYWHIPAGETEPAGEAEWAERIRDRMETAIVSEMVSDVPLGAFLSGGIDSSSIVAMMSRHSDRPVKTYSIGFDTGPAGQYYNELPYAREVSDLFGTEHKEILVRPNIAELLPRLLWHMDEPVADSAFITTYLVAKFAREDVTVILSGVGGDELFGGYRRYLGEYFNRGYHLVPAWLRRNVVAPLAGMLPSDRHSPVMNLSRYARAFLTTSDQPLEKRYRHYVQVFGEEALDRLLIAKRRGRLDSLDDAFEAACAGDALNRMMHVDLLSQLPNDLLLLTDKMTMAASIECRVPLLSHGLVELSARMPSALKIHKRDLKHILKVALSDHLPRSILYRRKRGFGAPMGAWIRNELAPLMNHVLSRESVERRGWLNWDAVDKTRALHDAGKEDHTDHLISLLNLEVWARLYLDGRSPDDVAGELAQQVRQ